MEENDCGEVRSMFNSYLILPRLMRARAMIAVSRKATEMQMSGTRSSAVCAAFLDAAMYMHVGKPGNSTPEGRYH